jgi:hypothetical protein
LFLEKQANLICFAAIKNLYVKEKHFRIT